MNMTRSGSEHCLLLLRVESNVASTITSTAIDNETLRRCV
jgi:hypothetical protein